MARISACFGDRREIYRVAKLLRTLVWPTRAGTEHLMGEMADPFDDGREEPADGDTAPTRPNPQNGRSGSSNDLTWREWLMLPLVGPVVMSGFLGGLVSQFLLRPLVSFAWRRRKYMADAAAVRLTRDPDAMSAMVTSLAGSDVGGLQPWALHMAIAGGGGGGLLAGSIVSIFPSLERRQRALVRMGATSGAVLKPSRTLPTPVLLLIGVLGTVAAALLALVVVLLVWLSLALSGIFTIVPMALLHALLRAI
jgi:hypothetical protein